MHNRLLYLFMVLLMACGEKKIDLTGENPIKAKDFITVFPIIPGNFTAADSNFIKLADTAKIGLKAILQFVPDTAIAKLIGKEKRITFYAIGKIVKEKEIYLLLNIKMQRKWLLSVIVLNAKSNAYLSSKALLDNSEQDEYLRSISINREPTFLMGREKQGKDNSVLFTRIGWIFSSELGFIIITNDSNEPLSKSEIINPIDTLPRKNKYSADYVQNKKNFISLRDGKNTGTYEFFIHFEKNDGACIGELKGELKMKSATTAIYTFNGDPCVIDFNFEDNEISIKEKGTCGNHRGIKCFFNDSFSRKREAKQKSKTH